MRSAVGRLRHWRILPGLGVGDWAVRGVVAGRILLRCSRDCVGIILPRMNAGGPTLSYDPKQNQDRNCAACGNKRDLYYSSLETLLRHDTIYKNIEHLTVTGVTGFLPPVSLALALCAVSRVGLAMNGRSNKNNVAGRYRCTCHTARN